MNHFINFASESRVEAHRMDKLLVSLQKIRRRLTRQTANLRRDAGASCYFIKSEFSDDALINAVQNLIGASSQNQLLTGQ